MPEPRRDGPSFLGEDSGVDGDSRGGEGAEPATTNTRVRIADPDHDTRDLRRDHRLGAGRSPAMVGTRLQGDVQGRPFRASTRLSERDDLGMWTSGGTSPSLSDNATVLDDDGTDGWVGARAAETLAR